METKLTLKLNKNTIEKAKVYAKKHNQSLSSLVSNYFTALTDSDYADAQRISPIVQELIGIVDIKSETQYKDIRDTYLLEKYIHD